MPYIVLRNEENKDVLIEAESVAKVLPQSTGRTWVCSPEVDIMGGGVRYSGPIVKESSTEVIALLKQACPEKFKHGLT